MEAGKRQRIKMWLFSLLSVSLILSGFCLVDTVSASTTTKFYSTFRSIADEPDWVRARSDGDMDHPYMDDGLLTTSRSGIYRTAEWLPHNYTYQCSFFISSVYSEYNGGLATLFSVYQSSISTGIFEVQVQVSQTPPMVIISGHGSNQLQYDHTYILNLTVTNNRSCIASLWSWSTGLDVICINAMNPAAMVAYQEYQIIVIGSLTMQSGNAKAHNIFFNYVKLDYWSGWDNHSTWTDTKSNIGASIELIVFFIPIMILAWTFGRPGFLLGSGLMTAIWVFTNPSFLWAAVMIFGSIGMYAYRGGFK